MPKKGSKVSETTRELMRIAAGSRETQLIRLGIVSREDFEAAQQKGLKWCGICKTFKEPNEFQKNQRKCRLCTRELFQAYYAKNKPQLLAARKTFYRDNIEQEKESGRKLKLARYGADQEWYDYTLRTQNGGCAICGIQEPSKGQKHFAVDHNHSCCSGRKRACNKCRRGLLCARCNASLERLESHPDWLQKAVTYLWSYGDLT